ncbi:MAG TPA: AMP-binding protein, partial [Opitutaceae bacterium]
MNAPSNSGLPLDIERAASGAGPANAAPVDFIWRPHDHPWTRDSHLAGFLRAQGFANFEDLRAAAVRDTTWFWDAVVRDLRLEWFQPYTQVRDDSAGFPWTRWFLGGALNLTHNCIDRHVRDGHGDEVALYYEPDSDDPADRRVRTFAELKAAVDDCAGALRALGVGLGDSVGLYAPMRPETVEVMFACYKIGARFVPVFCGYGEQALVDRLESCGAKVLFAVGHLHRRGKAHPAWVAAMAAQHRVATLQRVIFFDEFDHASGLSAPPAEM